MFSLAHGPKQLIKFWVMPKEEKSEYTPGTQYKIRFFLQPACHNKAMFPGTEVIRYILTFAKA